MKRHGIRVWLLTAFIVLALLPLLGGSWYFLKIYENALRETVAANLVQIANKKYDQIDSFLQERYADIRLLSVRPMVVSAIESYAQTARRGARYSRNSQGLADELKPIFEPYLEVGDYYDLLLIDSDGNVVYSLAKEADLGTNLYTGPYRHTKLAEGVEMALNFLQTNQTTFAPYAPSQWRAASFLVAPVLRDGMPIGAVALQLNWERLESVVTDKTGLGTTGETVLAMRDGDQIMFTGPLNHVKDAAFRYRIPVERSAVPMRNALAGGAGDGLVEDYARHPVVAAWRYLPTLNWGMVVKIDIDEAFAPLTRMRRITWVTVTVLASMISGIAFYFGRSLGNAVLRLSEATARMALGDFRVRAESNGPKELAELAASFNQMSGRLADLYTGLETKVKERDIEIEARKQAESALISAKDAAESASRAKSIFLANMSHELRTPLNAILGFAQILERDETFDERHRRKLETINRSGKHLLAVINDVLEISRIEAGKTEIQSEVFNLCEMLASVTDMVRVRAEAKGLAFASEQRGELPAYVSGDGHRLRQVLINLLGNAVKYTEQGTVTLRIQANQDEIHFEVADTGIGIAAKDLPRIFGAFYQTEAGIAKGEGTGLGLTISREFVRLMGGEIDVSSRPGQGSVFAFTLPLPEAEAPALSVKPSRVVGLAGKHSPIRVLVAEDNPDSRELITLILRGVGFEVRAVTNGRKAIACFESWHPHFIWMDMRMPVLDGYEATKAIRTLPGGQDVKIAALTASAFHEDRRAMLSAGCDDMLPKPVDENRLFRVMGDLLGLQYRYGEEGDTVPAERLLPMGAVDLSPISKKMRNELLQGAELLDADAIAAIVEDMRAEFPGQAKAIAAWLDAYRFDVIAKACRRHETSGKA